MRMNLHTWRERIEHVSCRASKLQNYRQNGDCMEGCDWFDEVEDFVFILEHPTPIFTGFRIPSALIMKSPTPLYQLGKALQSPRSPRNHPPFCPRKREENLQKWYQEVKPPTVQKLVMYLVTSSPF